MGNGYTPGRLDDEDRSRAFFSDILRRLAALETPTGTSINSLVAQVQQAIANINTTVNAAISANSYTKTQIDSKIASPGNIGPGNVTVGGQLLDPDAASYNITGGRLTVWVETATGRFGNTSSSRRYKQDIEDAAIDGAAVLGVVPYRFHYIDEIRKRDDPTFDGYVGPDYVVAEEYGFMAEDLHAAGLDPWVYFDKQGLPESVNYTMFVVPIVAGLRMLATDRDALRGRVDALEADMAAVKAKLGL